MTVAYRQLIGDLARTLSNNTSTVDEDVADIFKFEKQMAVVGQDFINHKDLIAFVSFLRFIGQLLNNERVVMKVFEQNFLNYLPC